MRAPVRKTALLAAWSLVPAVASAQQASSPTAEAPSVSQPSQPAAPSASTAPAPVVPATGYGWSTPKRKTDPRAHSRAPRGDYASALMPGFETLADGSSRLFVELSKPVAYEAKRGPGIVTYVLKGARVDRRNNQNPLVTVHFNTPVTSARLVPHGRDVHFVVELRANVQPTVAIDAGKGGGSIMRIEFPKGSYVPAQASAAAPPASSSDPAAPAPAPDR